MEKNKKIKVEGYKEVINWTLLLEEENERLVILEVVVDD